MSRAESFTASTQVKTDVSYYLEDKVPSPQEYYTLRKESGLTPPPMDRIEIALKNSVFGATIRETKTGQAVAMGRIIGDAGVFLYVTDMATLPAHQRRGLGARILEHLTARVDSVCPNAFLALFADPPGKKLYLKNGFVEVAKETAMYRTATKIVK